MLLLFPVFGGCTATILRGLTYPKTFHAPENKKEREEMATSRGVDRHLRVKHLVTQPGNAPKARPSHLTTADEVNKVSLKDSKAGSFRGCRP